MQVDGSTPAVSDAEAGSAETIPRKRHALDMEQHRWQRVK